MVFEASADRPCHLAAAQGCNAWLLRSVVRLVPSCLAAVIARVVAPGDVSIVNLYALGLRLRGAVKAMVSCESRSGGSVVNGIVVTQILILFGLRCV